MRIHRIPAGGLEFASAISGLANLHYGEHEHRGAKAARRRRTGATAEGVSRQVLCKHEAGSLLGNCQRFCQRATRARKNLAKPDAMPQSTTAQSPVALLTEDDWRTLLERIHDQKCTPFLGSESSFGVMPSRSSI